MSAASSDPSQARAHLERLVAEGRWFHAIDFGDGLVSQGRFGASVPPNYTLYGVFQLLEDLEFQGARVIDVGTMDGLTAFGMKMRGAGEVLALDLSPRETFVAGRDYLGLDIEYRVPVNALELGRAVGEKRADVVVLAGILYHVFDPIGNLIAARDALREGGFLLLETTYEFQEAAPSMVFNIADPSPFMIPVESTFWRASKSALEGMLELACFEVVATVASDRRIAILAQARHPDAMTPRAPFVRTVLSHYTHAHYNEPLNLAALRSRNEEPSTVRYVGPRNDRRIYPAVHQPSYPLRPQWNPPHAWNRWVRAAGSMALHAGAELAQARSRLARALRLPFTEGRRS